MAQRTSRRAGADGRSDDVGPADSCPVVGVGASAGGIGALQKLLANIKPDSGGAFVVVQHLDPDRASSLAEILARSSRIPVATAEDGSGIAPNRVYVIPPDAVLTIEDGRLTLVKPDQPRGRRTPIDQFLVSLAEDCGPNSACIILSGTGSDGTLGLRAIKEHGGLTLAQADAEYEGMMRSALATGLVDLVLPAEKMGAKIADYFEHLAELREKKGPDGARREVARHLAEICAALRARTGHDFSGYKESTVIRRIQRRMQVLQIEDASAYTEHLRRQPEELNTLFYDLLIGVTAFFRDPVAFEALDREVIPKLFADKGPEDTIRVWVPGCATGEEAYSIAILLREHLSQERATPKLQVFATDIDERALEAARIGRFPASIAKDISAERLRRHFTREDGTFRATSDLRDLCLFASHDLLRDPPFTRLDLISCRNLLIYMKADLQSRVIPLFHYALRPGSYLFLGSSENVSRHERLFSTVDKTNRIFQRRPQSMTKLPEFPLVSRHPPAPSARSPATGPVQQSMKELVERQILERHAPAYVVVNDVGDVLHTSSRTGRYLEMPAGTPDHNVFAMARGGLSLDLRAVLHKASATGRTVARNNISLDINGGHQALDLVVQPLASPDQLDPLYVIVFREVGPVRGEAEPLPDQAGTEGEQTTVLQLERELHDTRERLQTTTEQLESANEELRSANEELSSINEELQSSNEELETSKEELQSINEELQTVNSELSMRVEELSRANSDISNLLASTQIATVFLDREFRIKSFTPAAKELFRLVEGDVGRPVSHVRPRFVAEPLQHDLEQVLSSLNTVERTVRGSDAEAAFVMRIMPYRTTDDVIGGIVITFVDVTRAKLAEARIQELTRRLRERVENLETLLDLVPVGIMIADDIDGERVRINRYGATLIGGREDGDRLQSIGAELRLAKGEEDLPPDEQPLMRAARRGEVVEDFEGRLTREDGDRVEVMISATPLFDEGGKVRGGIAAIVDISARKEAEARQELLLHELQHRVKNILATVAALTSRILRTSSSPQEFADGFLGRLQAMARTHELLSRRLWEGADLKSLITTALTPYVTDDEGNVALTGPVILLRSKAASTLGMVFHELASNAAKYGALAQRQGRVEVSWERTENEHGKRLVLRWEERLASPAEHEQKEGFGKNFIERSISYELGGTVDLEFEPHGLRCTIELPAEKVFQEQVENVA